MFGLGLWEIVIIAVVALLVLGPDKLPQVAQQVGRGLRVFKKAANELQSTLDEAMYQDDDKRIMPGRRSTPVLKPVQGTAAHGEPASPPPATAEAAKPPAPKGE